MSTQANCRTVVFRLHPGSRRKHDLLGQTAGAYRYVRQTGWSGLRDRIEYKACTWFAVNPAHTSQRDSSCGHVSKASRRSHSEYGCAACGHEVNADVGAALDVMALGSGASGRREALELSTSPTRQHMNSRLVA